MARRKVAVAEVGAGPDGNPACASPVLRRRPPPSKTTVRFIEVPTARVLKFDAYDGSDVTGNFVKLTPRLRRSERANFDAAAAVADLKARGAAAAVAAPVVIPDEVVAYEQRSTTERVNARAEVVAWFGDNPDKDRVAALGICLRILDQVGF